MNSKLKSVLGGSGMESNGSLSTKLLKIIVIMRDAWEAQSVGNPTLGFY